jgi:homoserine O-acetyltransferase
MSPLDDILRSLRFSASSAFKKDETILKRVSVRRLERYARKLTGGLVASFLSAAPVVAQARPLGADYTVHNFHFADGSSFPELRMHYIALGSPKRDANGVTRNAVLILHGTTGSGGGFMSRNFAGELFGAGELLDTARYYVILPDGIGHGQSSKPSDGMHAKFPHYSYDDMVDAQHRLLTEGLKVNHLRLVMGTSMGCMHAWVWGERYPDFVDGLVPLACVPTQIAGRNRMLRKMLIDAIRTDPDWHNGEYAAPPERGLRTALAVLFMMTSSPLQQQKAAPTRDAADAYITKYVGDRLHSTDANDMLYAFDASRDYDPSGKLESITASVLAINSADDVVNPPELGLMEKLIPRVKHARYVLIPTSDQTRGHGTHSMPAVWKSYLAQFLQQLP